MGKYVEVKLYFISPMDRNEFVGIEIHKSEVRNIRMGKDEKGYWVKYEILEEDIVVSEHQKAIMKHCLGLDWKKRPYRNYYSAEPHNKEWNELVEKGLAIKSNKEPRNRLIVFWLSKQGVEFILGKTISDKFYKEL